MYVDQTVLNAIKDDYVVIKDEEMSKVGLWQLIKKLKIKMSKI